jgi:hypothetical protein
LQEWRIEPASFEPRSERLIKVLGLLRRRQVPVRLIVRQLLPEFKLNLRSEDSIDIPSAIRNQNCEVDGEDQGHNQEDSPPDKMLS